MNLPSPGPSYSAQNEAQARDAIAQADAANQKKGADVVIKNNRLILTSPDGTQWSVTIENDGGITRTAL